MSAYGYAGTPLLKKLGIKPGMRVLLINTPEDYFQLLEKDISGQCCRENEIPGLVHAFAGNQKEFENLMRKLQPLIKKNSSIIIWISWYKKSSGRATDLSEDSIRKFALQNNLVDVKVCAVSELWSGLKLVVPLQNRS